MVIIYLFTQIPTLQDACLQLLWRELDTSKNSISMLAHHYFSDNELHKLNGSQKQDKLMLEKGINWNDLEVRFKRGTYVKRIEREGAFTTDELNNLPEKHKARKNPELTFKRSSIEVFDMPIFSTIENKTGVVFFNEEPKTYSIK